MKDKKVNQSYAIKYCGCNREDFIKFFPEPESKSRDPNTGATNYQYTISNLDKKIPEIRKMVSARNADRMKTDALYRSKAINDLLERSNYKYMDDNELNACLVGKKINQCLYEAKDKCWEYISLDKKINHSIFQFVAQLEDLINKFPFNNCDDKDVAEINSLLNKDSKDSKVPYDYY